MKKVFIICLVILNLFLISGCMRTPPPNILVGFNCNGTDCVFSNNVTFEDRIEYNATKEIEINPSNVRLPGINPPLLQIIGNFPVLSFDKNTDESAYTSKHVVEDYKEGTPWEIAVYWAPDDTSIGNVSWCFEITVIDYDVNDLLTNSSNTICVLDEAQGTQYELLKSPKITGGTAKHDQEVTFRLYRDADAIADNYPDDAHMVESSIYYTSYRPGE